MGAPSVIIASEGSTSDRDDATVIAKWLEGRESTPLFDALLNVVGRIADGSSVVVVITPREA